MNRLGGKIALITGGTSGIGAATARLFQSEGATVIITGRNPDAVHAACVQHPGTEAVVVDQKDPIANKALMERIRGEHGRLDVLFVNAGVAQFAPLEKVTEEFYDDLFSVNVRGAYFTVKHAVPIMPDGSSIILTGSTAASTGTAGMSIYAATKAALRSFGRTLAAELAPRNIRVNTLSPGPIETPIFGKAGFTQEQIHGFLKDMRARVPLQRIGRAEEVAASALYLAADASFVTGAELLVSGGLANL